MELRDLVIVQLRVTVWANRILSADIRAAMYTEQALVLLNILAAIIYDRTSFVNSNSLCYCNENAFSVRYQKMCDFKILCYTSSSMAGFCPFYFLLCFFINNHEFHLHNREKNGIVIWVCIDAFICAYLGR